MGSTVGLQRITVGGTNFAAGATVMVGGRVARDIVVVSSTRIVATVPQHSTPGGVNVRVTTAGGTTETSSRSVYRYVQAARIGQYRAEPTVVAPDAPFRVEARPSCPQPTWCMAVGPSTAGTKVRVLSGGGWHVIDAPVPNEAISDPHSPHDTNVYGVSCWAVAECMVIGTYNVLNDGRYYTVPLLVRYDHRSWAGIPASEIVLEDSAYPRGVACVQSVCRVVIARSGEDGLLVTADGTDVTVAVLPAAPDVAGAHTSPAAIECPALNWCLVAGEYGREGETPRPGFVYVDGDDLEAHRLLTPSNSFQQLGPTAVDCAAVRECSFAGWYVDRNARSRAFVTSVSATLETTNQVSSLISVLGAGAPYPPALFRISCATGTNCVATMRFYDESVFASRDQHGWHVQRAPVVATARGAVITDVSCPSDDFCAALAAAHGPNVNTTELLIRRTGVWTPSAIVGATGTITCAAADRCAATSWDYPNVVDGVLTPPR